MEDMIQVMGNGFAGGIAPSKGPSIKGGSNAGSFSTSFADTMRASECHGTDKDAATTCGNAVGGNKDPLRRHDFPPESYGSSLPTPTQSDREDKVGDGTSDLQLFSTFVGNDYQTTQPNFSSIHGYSLSAPVGEDVRRLIHDDAFDFLALQPGTSAHENSDDVLVAALHGPRAFIGVDGFAHVLSHDESEVGTMVQQEGAGAFGKIDRQSLDVFAYRETWFSWEQYRSSGGVSDRSVDHRSVYFGIENRLLGEGGGQGITPQQITNTSARPTPPADSVTAPLPYDPALLEQKQGSAFYEGNETDATLSQRPGLISQDPSLLSNRMGVNHTESSQPGILFPDIKVSEQKSIGPSSTQVLGSEVRLRDPESFSTDLSTHLRVLKTQGGGEARLQLNPAEMGRMLVTVTTQGEDTRVAFVVESVQVKQVIEASLPRLRDLLEQSGMQLTDSDVRDRTSDHSNRGSGSEYQTQESETDDASHADVIAVNTDKRHLLDAYA
jgi:hypothetical protein